MPSVSHGNGVEAKRLSKLAAEVSEHGRQRAEVLLGASEADDEFSYNHVFPEPEFTVKVRYRLVGRMPPRRFDLED